MLGHIAVPALDPSGAPATLSAPMATDLLRAGLGFQGLIVTDAMEMAGVRGAWTGEAAVRAVRAGADVILLPPETGVAVQALTRAVREGVLPASRIHESVIRILQAKERLGLNRQRAVDPEALEKAVGRPEDVQRALEVARSSITVVRNDAGVLPLRADTPVRVLHLVLSSDARNDAIQGVPEDELERRRIPFQSMYLGLESGEERAAEVLAQERTRRTWWPAFVRVGAFRGNTDMSEGHARLLRRLKESGKPLIVVSFGSPYLCGNSRGNVRVRLRVGREQPACRRLRALRRAWSGGAPAVTCPGSILRPRRHDPRRE